ncbi:MAG TPA: hypothetical protein PKY24_12945 [Opitutaceae bacterium]|nr:hypothetical protein [Opitutaceae bacterium]
MKPRALPERRTHRKAALRPQPAQLRPVDTGSTSVSVHPRPSTLSTRNAP